MGVYRDGDMLPCLQRISCTLKFYVAAHNLIIPNHLVSKKKLKTMSYKFKMCQKILAYDMLQRFKFERYILLEISLNSDKYYR